MEYDREELRKIYQREENTDGAVFIPARGKADLYDSNHIFRVCAYCRVSTDSTEQLSSYYDASDSVKKSKESTENREIKIMVNDEKHCIIVKPVSSNEKDVLDWKKRSSKASQNRIECAAFGRKLYEKWNFDPEYRYRAVGKLVQCGSKVMLLYDFSRPEAWKGAKAVKQSGG